MKVYLPLVIFILYCLSAYGSVNDIQIIAAPAIALGFVTSFFLGLIFKE